MLLHVESTIKSSTFFAIAWAKVEASRNDTKPEQIVYKKQWKEEEKKWAADRPSILRIWKEIGLHAPGTNEDRTIQKGATNNEQFTMMRWYRYH